MFRTRLSPALLLAGLLSGCDDANRAAERAAVVRPVQDVGDLYRMYMLEHKKPPAAVADFSPYQEANPQAFRAVKDGEVVVVWNVKLTDLAIEGSKDSPDEVLAYEKKAPDEGGTVLMKDRSVRQMTAEEFRASAGAGSK